MTEAIPAYKSSIEFVINKLKEYSAIPSPTYEETNFLEFLVSDFVKEVNTSCLVTRRYDNKSRIRLNYVYITPISSDYEYFFTVHVDRVVRNSKPFTNTIEVNMEGNILTGQLDNIISIGILRYLWELGYRFGILFTTKEEVENSWDQVLDIKKKNKLVPISIDIDAYPSTCLEQIKKDNTFTLRERDGYGEMDIFHVWKLRKVAVRGKLNFIKDDSHLSLVETGLMSKKTFGEHKGVHIGIPIINYHSDKETTSLLTVYHTIVFVKRLLDQVKLIKKKE